MNVLLIDDHAVVRAGYRRFLEQSATIRVIAEAASAEEGYAAYCRSRPDVTVMDLSMPGMGGLQLIGRIRSRDPEAVILVFSMHEEALFAARALQAGARGYISKNSAPETLVQAVNAVIRGAVFMSPDIARQFPRGNLADWADPLAALSLREIEILSRIAEGRSIAEIALVMNLSQKTVANYQTQIKEKLGVNTVAALVHLAIRHGLVKPVPC